jgi:hypothetical protein
VLKAQAAVLVQREGEQLSNRGGCAFREEVQIWRSGDDARQDIGDRLTRERLPSREHLEEHAAEGPDVGARIDVLAASLFGRHVAGCADDHTRKRSAGDGSSRRRIEIGGPGRERFCQPEVEHLDGSAVCELDVRRFQVAVDDAALVGHGEGVGNLLRDADRLVNLERPVLEFLLERLALDQLHHDAGRPVDLLEAVDLRDVRMVQRSEDLCFPLESGKAVGVSGELLGEQLQCDIALQP